jgi:polysaccharide biosynthesis transport protein
VQYAQASAKFGSAYPMVKQLRNQLAQIDESIQAEISKLGARAENDYLTAKQTEDSLRRSFESQKAEANRLNDKAVQYTILKQDVESSRRLYDDLLGKLKEGGILAGLHSTNIVVLDPARTSATPARPIYLLNLAVGFAVGLFAGLAFAFVREGLDDALYTPEDVETTAMLPCVGIVPELSSCTEIPRRLRSVTPDVTMLSLAAPASRLAESYRAVRTWIFNSDPEKAPRVIMITSALPREGKTTTSLNTAIALAQDGTKVLAMEADLRRPSFHTSVSGSTNGLVGLLTDPEACKYEFIPHPMVPNLFVLPAGVRTSNPAELLGSERMKRFVEFLRTKFDFIVIDTPPILSFTDAAIVSRYADAVLFVVRSERTSKQSCLRARESHGALECPHIGHRGERRRRELFQLPVLLWLFQWQIHESLPGRARSSEVQDGKECVMNRCFRTLMSSVVGVSLLSCAVVEGIRIWIGCFGRHDTQARESNSFRTL